MTDIPDMPDKRVPGQNHPRLSPTFPAPWWITTNVSGWFCPSDQWPDQHNEGAWPGADPDTTDTTEPDEAAR